MLEITWALEGLPEPEIVRVISATILEREGQPYLLQVAEFYARKLGACSPLSFTTLMAIISPN